MLNKTILKPFLPEDYDFKISEFFNVDGSVVSSIVGNSSSHETMRDAFIGDSYLNYYATIFLTKRYPAEGAAVLTCLRSILVCNKNLAFICENYFYNDLKNISHLNEHSKGTIFEAILGKTPKTAQLYDQFKILFKHLLDNFVKEGLNEFKKKINLPQINETVAKYQKLDQAFQKEKWFIEANEIISYQKEEKIVKIVILDNESNVFDEKLLQRQNEVESLIKALKLKQKTNKFQLTHTGIIMEVPWRSRKGNNYIEKIYSCCGIPANALIDIFNISCPRKNWKNPNSYHTGELTCNSSRRIGAGAQSRSNIPYCAKSYWDCCRKKAEEEGCHFIQIALPSNKKKLESNEK